MMLVGTTFYTHTASMKLKKKKKEIYQIGRYLIAINEIWDILAIK